MARLESACDEIVNNEKETWALVTVGPIFSIGIREIQLKVSESNLWLWLRTWPSAAALPTHPPLHAFRPFRQG